MLGRDLVMVPKLIHPLPPNEPRTPRSGDEEDIDEEPPTPHPLNDTWMQAPHPPLLHRRPAHLIRAVPTALTERGKEGGLWHSDPAKLVELATDEAQDKQSNPAPRVATLAGVPASHHMFAVPAAMAPTRVHEWFMFGGSPSAAP